MNKDWTDRLHDRMTDYKEPVSEDLWKNIEAKMKEQSLINITPRKHASITWIKFVSLAAAAAVFVFIFLNINKEYTPQKTNDIASIKKEINKTIDAHDNIIDKSQTNTNNNILLAESGDNNNSVSTDIHNNISTIEEAGTNLTKNDSTKVLVSEKEPKTTTNNNTIAETGSVKGERNTGHKYLAETENRSISEVYKNHTSNMRINLYASNIPASANSHDRYSSTMMAAKTNNNMSDDTYSNPYQAFQPITTQNGNNALTTVMANNSIAPTKTNIKHKQPIRLGLSFTYDITRHWSVESGLTYTYLSSDIYSGNDNNNYQSKQKLHYLGIPLNVIYNIWSSKSMSVYVLGGGMGEYCIDGRLTTDYIINNEINDTGNEKIKNHHIQWSLNGSAGVQYKITPNIGVYMEPGISHYFNDGSDIQTIYKEHPNNFNLKVGFRFNFK